MSRHVIHEMPTLDGIINLHKPIGITSAKALYRVRSITGQRKSGHAGTLDPGASGVLVLCLGRATKLVESIMDQPKVYRATARLDVTSESLDADSPLVSVRCDAVPSLDQIADVLLQLEGDILQVPPRISALKIAGVPAYKRARQGQPFDLAARPVRVYWLCLHAYKWPTLDFEVCCGRGTYIRSLIRDIGERLGTGGCLSSLVRSRVGPFSLDDGRTVESLQNAAGPEDYLIPLERAREMLDPAAITIPARPSVA